MSVTVEPVQAPPEPLLQPFRTCAMATVSAQDVAQALGQGGVEAVRALVLVWSQGAQLGLGWAAVGAASLAEMLDSRPLDLLFQHQLALAQAQVTRSYCAAMAATGRTDVDPREAAPIAVATPVARREPPTPDDEIRISDCMTREVERADAGDTIAQAARLMARLDARALPVSRGDRLVGTITDRDIAIHAVAQGKGPDARVDEVMNAEVNYCFDDQEAAEVLRSMGALKLPRMPVLNHDQRLVGMVSARDLAAGGARAI